jgi:hypothetical protein
MAPSGEDGGRVLEAAGMPELPQGLCHNKQSAGHLVHNMLALYSRNNSPECTLGY